MKKSTFVACMLGTISGVFFALGMCMALLSEWNALKQGIIFGVIGLLLGVITIFVWRKMEHKKPISFNARRLALCALGILAALVFGIGLCFCILWNRIIPGTLIGVIGILLFLVLIPLTKGWK